MRTQSDLDDPGRGRAGARDIRRDLSFIIISSVFSSILLLLLGLLFALSTPKSRRTPIFILNVLAVSLAILSGSLCIHLMTQDIMSPMGGVNAAEDFFYAILSIWMPWMTESILLLRVVVVYRPSYPRLSSMVPVLALPVVLKATRAAISILFLVQRKRNSATDMVAFPATDSFNTWTIKVAWILEPIDTA
ncbi:hypothetical protein H0H81_009804 [Sphagnurus paluster]|uniref:Uncharacterized protein n=1 Tax=Sphagnurus paluster TaxID=117069 RepID=A0A9P7GQF0_9AGAR|nr:hypothetical protein H0H81_009804 [Sphagnurus paluster]